MQHDKPYIGISGVATREQQRILKDAFIDSGLQEHRVLQLGIKATHKTQYLGVENKYGREWYPVGDEIASAATFDTMITGVAQVCFDSELVHNAVYRARFIQQLGKRAHGWLTGVQFDMLPWHTHPETLDEYPNLDVILQCHADAMNAHSPKQIATKLAHIANKLDYVLFDASCGTGKRLDVDRLLWYLDAAAEQPELTDTGFVIGGGLNGTVVRQDIPKIVKHFPMVSWDAEGQLHSMQASGVRPLSMAACYDYIEASAEVLR